MLADSKIKIRQIEAFRCFMLSGTVTGAAELMYISQPAVSRLLSELEYRVGFPLFVRTHNKLEATPEAKLFYKDVNRVFIGMNSLASSADAIARNNQGRLRVGVMPICSNSFMPDVIAAFLSLHPNVSIELESASRIQLLDMVRSHRIDIAITTNVEADEEEFDCRFLRRHRAVVLLHEGHPLADKDSLSPIDLKHERFMTLAYGSPFRTRVEDAFLKQSVKRNIILEAREQSTLFQLVKKGVGIAILDPFVLQSGADGIVSRPFEPVTEWEYHVVQAKGIQTPRMVNAFLDILFEYFENPALNQDPES
ncbi:LysR substrate-binding domain-containing protein [Shewanella sp. MBTL60-007]|uniref:LysR substrate-binding domain-containing protein n=1 Tax=Shewanella sp. MBTL60-007 TaxID=2815911 RepID=UPI001BC18D17|nr:LysR substrate-binding domain-containing protein [Shewanella sp. MBTL60-007]GIU31674.1 regulatory protein NocR [Shewanella sp. MBTL60-007]